MQCPFCNSIIKLSDFSHVDSCRTGLKEKKKQELSSFSLDYLSFFDSPIDLTNEDDHGIIPEISLIYEINENYNLYLGSYSAASSLDILR